VVLSGSRRQRLLQNLAAFVVGTATVAAFAPLGFWFLAPLALAVLFFLWRDAHPRRAFVLGWWYGAGLLGFGLFWLRVSLAEFGGIPLPLAVIAALALSLALSLFPAIAGALCAWLSPGGWRRSAFAAPAAWVLVEWLRQWVLTGLPWLQLGYSQIDGPLGGIAPLAGVLGVTLSVALVAGWLAALAGRDGPRTLGISVMLLIFAAALFRLHHWTEPAGERFSAALLQGNIPQDEKWLEGNLMPTINRYLEMTEAHAHHRLIVWPEAAVPAMADDVNHLLLDPLQQFATARDTTVLMGILFYEEENDAFFTSMLALDEQRARYDKRHLVPFGEYFPLGFLWKDALRGLATIGEDFTPGSAPTPLLQVGPWPVAASVCYEVLFGEETRQALPEAQFLVNVSNDGWFGDSLGPHQHLEIARMRALETGRWLLRATNTGITAVIDAGGRVTHRLPQFRRGVLEAEVEPRSGATPYVRWGEWPALGLMALLGLWARYGPGRKAGAPAG
jgi:apolipoprotein N-acyltransferase